MIQDLLHSDKTEAPNYFTKIGPIIFLSFYYSGKANNN